jgi:Terminase large subunit, T4likevirus-type, N-terminal
VGEVAKRLGTPLMPWQQHVADVILEIDPDTGRLAYSKFGLTVPRQSGKTTLILAKAIHRGMATDFFGRRQKIVYTAQTREKAREKWEEDFATPLEENRYFAPKIEVHKRNGSEHIRFPNSTRFGIESNTEKAGHGGTIDEAYIDEAFAQADRRLEQAFRPAMITRPNKQLGVVSTAGWLGDSPYLWEEVEAGRLAVKKRQRYGLAYFEWSATEEEDPYDPDTWWRCMPALGYTIDEEAIRAELDEVTGIGFVNFCRAYLNRWVKKDAVPEWSIIPKVAWLDREREPIRPDGPVIFAVASAWPDAQETAIVVLGRVGDEIVGQVIEHRPGASWAVPRVKQLLNEWLNVGVVIDRGGPAGRLITPMIDAGIETDQIVQIGMQEAGRAFGTFLQEVAGDAPRFCHFGQPELTKAVAAAGKRPLGDGFTWARKDAADVSPVEAMTIGLYKFLELVRLNAPTESVYESRGMVEL